MKIFFSWLITSEILLLEDERLSDGAQIHLDLGRWIATVSPIPPTLELFTAELFLTIHSSRSTWVLGGSRIHTKIHWLVISLTGVAVVAGWRLNLSFKHL